MLPLPPVDSLRLLLRSARDILSLPESLLSALSGFKIGALSGAVVGADT